MGLDSGFASVVPPAGPHLPVLLGGLRGAPRAALLEPSGTVLVLTMAGLDRVGIASGVCPVATLPSMLMPNSLARAPSGELFVGFHHYVARMVFAEGRYSTHWLAPASCQHFKHCACATP